MMRLLRLLLLGLGLVAAPPGAAVEVQGLYEARVPQTERGPAARSAAIRLAMERVLTKVTGRVALDKALQPLVDDAERYLRQYRFEEVERTEEEVAPEEAGAPEEEAEGKPLGHLRVWFDRQPILEALQQRGQPVWPATRPRTLVWLAVEDGGGRHLVGANEAGPWPETLRQRAEARGLPAALPLLDLQDRARIESADVWGGFRQVIEKASERYQAQAILVGRAFRSGKGVWQARWSLYQGNSDRHWQARVASREAAAAAGVDGAADALAERFAQTYGPGAAAGLLLQVDGVGDLAGYRRVVEYLLDLDGVAELRVMQVEPSRLTCRLALEVAPRHVVQSIGLGSVLEKAEPVATGTEPVTGESDQARRYRLQP